MDDLHLTDFVESQINWQHKINAAYDVALGAGSGHAKNCCNSAWNLALSVPMPDEKLSNATHWKVFFNNLKKSQLICHSDVKAAIHQNEDIYILLDGLSYNTRGYFASCVVFFRAPQVRGKMRAMSKMSKSIMLNHLKRNLLFRYKKVLFWFNFIS